MAFLSDNILDNGLAYAVTHGTVVYLCSQQPANYTEASSTYALANKTGVTVGAPENGASNGRRVIIPTMSGGSVTGTGTATHYALVKPTSTTELLASGALSSSQALTSGNTWSTSATISVTIPDPA
jgi:hypothetical protein